MEPSEDPQRDDRLKDMQMASNSLSFASPMDLGTRRREFILTADRNTRFDYIDLQTIEASRDVNTPGSEANKLAKKNKSKLSAWNNCADELEQDDNEDVSTFKDGQTHRARLMEKIQEDTGPDPLIKQDFRRGRGGHRGGRGSDRGRGRGMVGTRGRAGNYPPTSVESSSPRRTRSHMPTAVVNFPVPTLKPVSVPTGPKRDHSSFRGRGGQPSPFRGRSNPKVDIPATKNQSVAKIYPNGKKQSAALPTAPRQGPQMPDYRSMIVSPDVFLGQARSVLQRRPSPPRGSSSNIQDEGATHLQASYPEGGYNTTCLHAEATSILATESFVAPEGLPKSYPAESSPEIASTPTEPDVVHVAIQQDVAQSSIDLIDLNDDGLDWSGVVPEANKSSASNLNDLFDLDFDQIETPALNPLTPTEAVVTPVYNQSKQKYRDTKEYQEAHTHNLQVEEAEGQQVERKEAEGKKVGYQKVNHQDSDDQDSDDQDSDDQSSEDQNSGFQEAEDPPLAITPPFSALKITDDPLPQSQKQHRVYQATASLQARHIPAASTNVESSPKDTQTSSQVSNQKNGPVRLGFRMVNTLNFDFNDPLPRLACPPPVHESAPSVTPGGFGGLGASTSLGSASEQSSHNLPPTPTTDHPSTDEEADEPLRAKKPAPNDSNKEPFSPKLKKPHKQGRMSPLTAEELIASGITIDSGLKIDRQFGNHLLPGRGGVISHPSFQSTNRPAYQPENSLTQPLSGPTEDTRSILHSAESAGAPQPLPPQQISKLRSSLRTPNRRPSSARGYQIGSPLSNVSFPAEQLSENSCSDEPEPHSSSGGKYSADDMYCIRANASKSELAQNAVSESNMNLYGLLRRDEPSDSTHSHISTPKSKSKRGIVSSIHAISTSKNDSSSSVFANVEQRVRATPNIPSNAETAQYSNVGPRMRDTPSIPDSAVSRQLTGGSAHVADVAARASRLSTNMRVDVTQNPFANFSSSNNVPSSRIGATARGNSTRTPMTPTHQASASTSSISTTQEALSPQSTNGRVTARGNVKSNVGNSQIAGSDTGSLNPADKPTPGKETRRSGFISGGLSASRFADVSTTSQSRGGRVDNNEGFFRR